MRTGIQKQASGVPFDRYREAGVDDSIWVNAYPHKRKTAMSKRIETRLRHAIELQKRCGRKLFFPDNEQWELNDEFRNTTERINDSIASLFAELEVSSAGLAESAFYLAAKQLSDCRSMYLCKAEQRKMRYPQELWPKAPYIHPDRLTNSTFEELYPVEHLSTLFRLCADLIDDCRLSFNDTDAELICDVLRFQFDSTKKLLEKAGYSFCDFSDHRKDVKIDHIVLLTEHVVWG